MRREDLMKIEEEAVLTFEAQYFLLNKSSRSRREHLAKTPRVIENLQSLWESSGSEKVLGLTYHLQLCYHLYKPDYQAILDFGTTFDAILRDNKLGFSALAAANRHSMAYACLKLKDYQQGFQLSQSVSHYPSARPLGEVSYCETRFMLALRKEHYGLAEDIATVALKKSGPRQASLSVLRWQILQGYLQFLADPEKLGGFVDFKRMRIEVEQLAGGASLEVLFNILEFTCRVAEGRAVDAILLFPEVDTSIRSYKTFSQLENRRLEWFRGLLFLLCQNGFELEKVNPSAVKILKKLESAYDPYSPTEIIPFNNLGRFYIQKSVNPLPKFWR